MKNFVVIPFRWVLVLLCWAVVGGCSSSSKPVGFNTPYTLSKGSFVSFWKQQVQYPMSVSYYTASDPNGQDWEIAVADSHADAEQRDFSKIVVLIHGRGANMGYFSQLMGHLMKAGIRVVAVDLPGYGKSLPGNLDKPIPRTLSDSRSLVHDVLVNQMRLKKASYLGHSLGGQWVIGYALQYPDVVDNVILESSYGLEEYDGFFQKDKGTVLPLFDPSYRYDYEKWKLVWRPLGQLEHEFLLDEKSIRAFYQFKQIDYATGQERSSDTGYFWQESIDSAFLTSVRVGMISANPQEYDRYVRTSVWDIYAQGIEVIKSNQNSLVKKLNQLNVPTMLAFGQRDPFLPSQAFSGNDDLLAQLIRPAVTKLMATGNRPVVVIYQNAGHIPHADTAVEFSNDVIQFVGDGSVASETVDVFGNTGSASISELRPEKNPDSNPEQSAHIRRIGNMSYISQSEKMYLQRIQQKVNHAFQTQSREAGHIGLLQGKLYINMTVGEYGLLQRVEILEGSENAELNKLALKAFTSSSPFPDLPGEWAPNIKEFEVQRYWELGNGELKLVSSM